MKKATKAKSGKKPATASKKPLTTVQKNAAKPSSGLLSEKQDDLRKNDDGSLHENANSESRQLIK